MAEILAASLFAAGYLVISLEERLFVNKAAASLVLGSLLWVLVGLVLPTVEIQDSLAIVASDIFGLVVFLLTAMTLVEILIHYHFFDVIEKWLNDRGWTTYQLGWAIGIITFFFSAFLDNLTTTIVAIQIARRFFIDKTRLLVGVLIVIAANAGGAFSPIGDVTTLMLWFAHKFTADQIIIQGFLPSLVLMLVAGIWLLRKVDHKLCGSDCENPLGFSNLSRSDRLIILSTLASFLLPLLASSVDLPPYIGLLTGLGMVWLLIDVLRRARPQETHLQANIKRFFQQTDLESIHFFIGILLAVGALHALGVLHILTTALLGTAPEAGRIITSFVGLGLGSAIFDNVPLTAAMISALDNIPANLWVLLALTVGTGGSMLAIGSAAGVIAMGMIPEITFMKYLKIGSLPAAAGFAAAVLVWFGQYALFG